MGTIAALTNAGAINGAGGEGNQGHGGADVQDAAGAAIGSLTDNATGVIAGGRAALPLHSLRAADRAYRTPAPSRRLPIEARSVAAPAAATKPEVSFVPAAAPGYGTPERWAR
jgi:hypothetical protein